MILGDRWTRFPRDLGVTLLEANVLSENGVMRTEWNILRVYLEWDRHKIPSASYG